METAILLSQIASIWTGETCLVLVEQCVINTPSYAVGQFGQGWNFKKSRN